MAIGSAVTTAANMNLEILTVGGLEDELVEVRVMLKEIKPHFWFMVQGSWQLAVNGLISVQD